MDTTLAAAPPGADINPIYIENHFGMASDNMVLGNRDDKVGTKHEPENVERQCGTKIDVPFSRYSIQDRAPNNFPGLLR